MISFWADSELRVLSLAAALSPTLPLLAPLEGEGTMPTDLPLFKDAEPGYETDGTASSPSHKSSSVCCPGGIGSHMIAESTTLIAQSSGRLPRVIYTGRL